MIIRYIVIIPFIAFGAISLASFGGVQSQEPPSNIHQWDKLYVSLNIDGVMVRVAEALVLAGGLLIVTPGNNRFSMDGIRSSIGLLRVRTGP